MKAFEFYFCQRTPIPIEFKLSEVLCQKVISGPLLLPIQEHIKNGIWMDGLDITTSQVKVMLECGDKDYCVDITKGVASSVIGSVYRINQFCLEPAPGEETIFIANAFYTIEYLDFFGADEVMKCVREVEEIISRDYWNNGGDGEGDEDRPSPELPKVPSVPSDLEPVLA